MNDYDDVLFSSAEEAKAFYDRGQKLLNMHSRELHAETAARDAVYLNISEATGKQLAELADAVQQKEAALKELKEAKTEKADLQKKINRLQSQYDSLEPLVSSIKREFSSANAQLESVRNEYAGFEEKILVKQAEYEEVKRALRTLSRRSPSRAAPASTVSASATNHDSATSPANHDSRDGMLTKIINYIEKLPENEIKEAKGIKEMVHDLFGADMNTEQRERLRNAGHKASPDSINAIHNNEKVEIHQYNGPRKL